MEVIWIPGGSHKVFHSLMIAVELEDADDIRIGIVVTKIVDFVGGIFLNAWFEVLLPNALDIISLPGFCLMPDE